MFFLMQVFLATQCDAGASAYVLLEELEDELDKGGAVVEVGSDRGEGSTAFLSSLANRTGREFFSVDFSNEGRQNAEQACGSCAHQGMGEVWLENEFPKLSTAGTIALAYLDNYDWTYPWTKGMQYKQQQHVDYNAKGLELSNQRSQEVHLLQAVQVERFCTERCFVLFDDTWPSAGMNRYSGKGGAALAFLLANGFEPVQQSPPDTLSHLGWVLVRRLPAGERPPRVEPEEIRGARAAASAEVKPVLLRIASPAEGGSAEGPQLSVEALVQGAMEGEHTLVVHSEGVEVMRVSQWEGWEQVCMADGSSWREGSGDCDSTGRRVTVMINDVRPGTKHMMLQVVDGLHHEAASAQVSFEVV